MKNRFHRMRRMLCLGITLAGVTACALTPEPAPPEIINRIEVLQQYEGQKADAAVPPEETDWWRRIGGDELHGMVVRLLDENFSLAEARAQARQAAERAIQVRAGRKPSLSASADPSYDRIRSASGGFTTGDNYAVGLVAGWDTDVFGSLRAADRAAQLSAAAAYESYRASEQQQIASLATNWVAAATLTRRVELAYSIAESFRRTYELTDNRYRTGSASASATDVQIARQNLDSALVDIPNLQAQLTTQLFVIDEQLAQLPGEAAGSFAGRFPSLEFEPPVGMPAVLLARRPDVAAAALTYRAALEDVGSARANLFPALTLSGSLSFQSEELDGLFSWGGHLASLAASLTQPIYQGGALRSEVRLQQAEADELAAAYGRVAIAAVADVETALAEQAGFEEQVRRLEDAVASARIADQLTQNRYRQGLSDILSVLETQRSLNSARENLILAEQSLLNARINLYLALGGVWFDPAAEDGEP